MALGADVEVPGVDGSAGSWHWRLTQIIRLHSSCPLKEISGLHHSCNGTSFEAKAG